jgi:uncharacterized membrane protein YsdA (DUF1294 family)
MAYIGIYLIIISVLSAGLTLYDKSAAPRGARRIKERTLLIISAFGGSVAMYVVMRIARHKTKHLKFMAGIPVIIVMQIFFVVAVWQLFERSAL